jgi:hypothetical protein
MRSHPLNQLSTADPSSQSDVKSLFQTLLVSPYGSRFCRGIISPLPCKSFRMNVLGATIKTVAEISAGMPLEPNLSPYSRIFYMQVLAAQDFTGMTLYRHRLNL